MPAEGEMGGVPGRGTRPHVGLRNSEKPRQGRNVRIPEPLHAPAPSRDILRLNAQEPLTLGNQTNRDGPPDSTSPLHSHLLIPGTTISRKRPRLLPPSPRRGFPPRSTRVSLCSLRPIGISLAKATDDLPRYLIPQVFVGCFCFTALVTLAALSLLETPPALGLCDTVSSSFLVSSFTWLCTQNVFPGAPAPPDQHVSQGAFWLFLSFVTFSLPERSHPQFQLPLSVR